MWTRCCCKRLVGWLSHALNNPSVCSWFVCSSVHAASAGWRANAGLVWISGYPRSGLVWLDAASLTRLRSLQLPPPLFIPTLVPLSLFSCERGLRGIFCLSVCVLGPHAADSRVGWGGKLVVWCCGVVVWHGVGDVHALVLHTLAARRRHGLHRFCRGSRLASLLGGQKRLRGELMVLGGNGCGPGTLAWENVGQIRER